MHTVAEISTFIQDIMNDTSASMVTSIGLYMNPVYRKVKKALRIPNEVKTWNTVTVASQAAYTLPIDCDMPIDVKIIIGGIDYYPVFISSYDQWNILVEGINTTNVSDYPIYVRILPSTAGNKLEIYPAPASAGNTISMKYHTLAKDLVSGDFSDYTTGTVSITNGAAAVTGVGTVFPSNSVGRSIRFDSDGFWYPITVRTNNTALTIGRNYEGTTVAGGTYKIGTVLALPSDANELIAYLVIQKLWEKREDFTVSGGKATYYRSLAAEKIKELRLDAEELFDSPSVNYIEPTMRGINPNDYPLNIG